MNLFHKYKYNLFKNEHIPSYLIFTTKYNDSSILIMIISWDYLNLSLVKEYVGDVTIPTKVIKYNQCCSRQINQSDCSNVFITNKLNRNINKEDVLYWDFINKNKICFLSKPRSFLICCKYKSNKTLWLNGVTIKLSLLVQ